MLCIECAHLQCTTVARCSAMGGKRVKLDGEACGRFERENVLEPHAERVKLLKRGKHETE